MCIKRTGKYIIALFVVGLSLAISTVAQACCICDGHWAFRHYIEYVYTPIDSEYHECASHWSGTCVNCQGRWYLACQPNGEPRREKHSYDSWGECTKCGYTQSSGSTATPKPTVTSAPGTCPPHTPITEYLYTTYTPANDSKHDVLLHNKVTCSACGTMISPDQVETQWAIHNFGSGSTCLDCGYSKAGYYMSVDQGHINGLAAYVGGGQGATINVTSNVEWTAVPDVNWIHIDNWTGSGNGSFSVSVDANNGYAREGHILLVGTHGASIDIKVSQEGAIVDPATCAHDYGYDYYSATDSKWVSLGSDEHQRIELYYTYVCTICGHTYQDWGSDVEEVIEAHTFGATSWTRWMSNEKKHSRNGKKTCSAPGCGQVENEKETGEHSYDNLVNTVLTLVDVDEIYHRWDELLTYECSCGKRKEVLHTGQLQEHSFSDGKCGCERINDSYADIMNALLGLKPGENAMKNPAVVEGVKKRIAESAHDDDVLDDVLSALTKAPETYQRLYIFSMFDYGYDTVDVDNYYADNSDYTNWGGEWFKTDADDRNVIHLEPSAEVDTWYHEAGHAIDYNCQDDVDAYSTKTWELYHVLCSDLTSVLEHYMKKAGGDKLSEEEQQYILAYIVGASGEETKIDRVFNSGFGVGADFDVAIPSELTDNGAKVYKKVVENLSLDLLNDEYSLFAGTFSATGYDDVISGLTNNIIIPIWTHRRSDERTLLGITDDCEEYWYSDGEQTGMASAEAWANYFEAVMLNNKEAIKGFKKYFPNACEYMDKMAAEMMNLYIERAETTLR